MLRERPHPQMHQQQFNDSDTFSTQPAQVKAQIEEEERYIAEMGVLRQQKLELEGKLGEVQK